MLYLFIGVHPAVTASALRIPGRRLGSPYRQGACQGLRLAVAPRSIAKSRSADGNLSFMALIRLSGSLALVSSSSNANKYVSVNATAVLASTGAPTLLCPGMTTDGCNTLIVFNELNHLPLAMLSVSAVYTCILLNTTSPAMRSRCPGIHSIVLASVSPWMC